MQPKIDTKIFKRNRKSLALRTLLRYYQAIETQEVFTMACSENLQSIRTQAGVTQEQWAEQLDVSRQSVSKWESGVSHN